VSYQPPKRFPSNPGPGGYWISTGARSPRLLKPSLLVAVYFEWEDKEGTGPNTFVCACLDRASSELIWKTTTGDWPAGAGLGSIINVTFAANSPVVLRNAGFVEPMSALGNIPDHAWIAENEVVVVGDDRGVNLNQITKCVFSFLEPWD